MLKEKRIFGSVPMRISIALNFPDSLWFDEKGRRETYIAIRCHEERCGVD